jgi:hypothetical protein
MSLTVAESTSRAVFNAKLLEIVADAENRSCREAAGEPARPFVTLAAIDVDSVTILGLLRKTSDDARFGSFWQTVNRSSNRTAFSNEDSSITAPSWPKKPHVTMIHFSQADQDRIYSVFAPLEGHCVELRATSIVWSHRIAALEVDVAEKTSHGDENDVSTGWGVRSVPRPRNDFVHVTIWCSEDASAVEANALPLLVESKQAERVELLPAVEFRGVFHLWTR